MIYSLPKSHRIDISGNRFSWPFLIVAMVLIAARAQPGRSSPPQEPIRVTGTVRDWNGRLIPRATIFFQAARGTEPLSTPTGADGTFVLTTLQPGAYTVWAEKAGAGKSAVASITLSSGTPRQIDLVLLGSSPAKPSSAASRQTPTPPGGGLQFKDEPAFTVAGLTDWTNAGGHGSDVHLRASESLTRETLALPPKRPGDESVPGDVPAREKELRANLEREPESFAANHALGEFCLRSQHPAEAIPFLQHARQINPADYSNGLDLALAWNAAGQYAQAGEQVRLLLKQENRAELHRLLGDINEKLNDPLEAVREYELATRLDPSETNYFAWGTELLYHRAIDAALQVFARASRAHPRSARLLMGQAVALYARGSNAEAARRLAQACRLDPGTTAPYLFMGKMESAVRAPIPGAEEMEARFLSLHPHNADAHYYYALSLWKRDRLSHSAAASARIESLLRRALQLDPRLAPAYLQLGSLLADEQRFADAIAAFRQAIQLAPDLEEAHYRLAQAYTRSGEEAEGKREFQVYERVSREQAAEKQKERRAIRQFVIVLRDQPPSPTP